DVLVDGVFVPPFNRWQLAKTGTVKVTIGCPADALQGCDGTLSLQALDGAAARTQLGAMPVHVDAGKNLDVYIPLSKPAQQVVRQRKLVHVLAQLTLADQRGHSTTTSQGSVLQPAPV